MGRAVAAVLTSLPHLKSPFLFLHIGPLSIVKVLERSGVSKSRLPGNMDFSSFDLGKVKNMARKGIDRARQIAEGLNELELKVEEATNNDKWGPHGSLMSGVRPCCVALPARCSTQQHATTPR